VGKILITGAGGFVGGYIARYLQENGYDVTGVVHHSTGKQDFPVYVADLAHSLDVEEHFDVIVHAAGERPLRRGEHHAYKHQDVQSFKQNNIDSMSTVLAFAERKKVKRIIYLSSIGVYGEFHKTIIDEQADIINPDTYGVTKYVAECLLRDKKSIDKIILRMPGIIGPFAQDVWFTNVIDKMRRDEDITIFSPDFQTKNFVWLNDLAKFIDHLIKMDYWKYDILNLACSQSASVREIVTEMKRLTGSSSKIIVDNSVRAPFCLDSQRAVELGYRSLDPLGIVRAFIGGTR
jgi:nucleoside-diphosphate-sugar epimerase